MIDPFFFSLGIAIVTLIFYLVFDIFHNIKFRKHLLLVSGLLLVVIQLIVHPTQEPGDPFRSLYSWSLVSPLFLLPFFILAPIPYIKEKTGIVFNKMSIFFGAFLSSLYYFVISEYGNYYLGQDWQLDGLVWTVCSLAPATLIFLGMYLGQKFLSPVTEEKTTTSVSAKSVSAKKSQFLSARMRAIIILAASILLFWIPFLILGLLGNTETCGGFEVNSIDQSQISNGTIVHHLTENDFREFPRMASIIRDHKQGTYGSCQGNVQNCAGTGSFRCNEQAQISKFERRNLEYEGRFYYISRSWVA